MSQVYTIGRVTADFEMKTSAKKTLYVRFSIAEHIGFGKNTRTQYLNVWAFGRDAQRILDMNVRKGCLVWITGSLTLEEFERRDRTKDKRLKVILADWGFVPTKQPKTEKAVGTQPEAAVAAEDDSSEAQDPSVVVIDGDREDLPE